MAANAALPDKPAATPLPSSEVTLQIGGQNFTGWQDVRITRGIEVFPGHAVLRLTERLPGQPGLLSIDPGATCQVMVGQDLVITGYVDTYEGQVSMQEHQVSITVRSATEDLVDCAAGVTSGQESSARMTFHAANILQLATDLCAPFGITVTEPDGEGDSLVSTGDGIPQFTIQLNQSVYDVLEPRAQWKQLLLIDGADGNLVLAKVGTKAAASGFTMPASAMSARVGFRKQDRYTIYLPALFAFDAAFDVSAATHSVSGNYFAPVKDDAAFKGQPRRDSQPRYRPHFVVSDQNIFNIVLSENLAQWEKSRRYGRSQAVTVTVSLWRDQAGGLWTPNTLAPVDIPVLKLSKLTWIVSEVTYYKGFGGPTRAEVTLMPPEAFQPAPTLLTAYDPQIAQATGQALQSKTATDRGSTPGSTPRGGG